MDKLYFINNCGCDDTTRGIARIYDEVFPKFKAIIENLNKNSTYGCMPKIRVYKIPDDAIVKIDNFEDYYDYEHLYLDVVLVIWEE